MSYFRPFISSLVVSLVILVLQFLSRYKGDLFGKGLSFGTVLQIFSYASISLMVMALPVAVLISSLFTMGNFGENYELAAMRSAGMSVPRILRPMFLLTLLISAVSFGLSSYIVPWANLKLYVILYDVQQLKPVFRLEPGHFNSGVNDYVIRITDKDVSKEMLYGVRIYDHTNADSMAVQIFNKGTSRQLVVINDSSSRNNRFVYADSGTMKIDPYGKYLNMMLYSGVTYEAKTSLTGYHVTSENFVRLSFDSLFYSFDMKGFAAEESKEEDFSSHQYMLNLSELGHAVDSIRGVKVGLTAQLETSLSNHVKIDSTFMNIDTTLDGIPPDNVLLSFPQDRRKNILKNAIQRMMTAASIADQSVPIIMEEDRRIRERAIEFHGKMSLPLACLLFLFIGAPLGAIVRKGGIGLPIIISFSLFMGFYVLMIEGKKMATEGLISPFLGAWLPVIVLFPLAVILSLESTTAVGIFTTDNLWHFSRNLVRILIITNPLYWIYRIPPVGRGVDWLFGKLFRKRETKRTFRVRR